MKLIQTFVFFFLLPAIIFAQDLPDGQYLGHIVQKDGKKVAGIIKLPHETYPWVKQTKIFFFETETIPEKKIKKKQMKKLKPKDIAGFEANGKVYETIQYVNITGAAKGNKLSGLNRAATMSKNLKKSYYFAEVYRSDKVSLYRFYNAPPSFSISSGEETKELANMAEDARKNYDILIKKEGKKAKSFNDVNIKKYFKDCAFVVKKYKKKGYKKKPLRGLKSALANSKLYGESLAAAASEIIDDYIKECK